MKYEGKYLLVMCLLCLFLGVSATMSYIHFEPTNKYRSLHERTNNSVNGVYFPAGAYCVHLDARTLADIERTVAHEQLHALIDKGSCGGVSCREHFCG